MINLQSTIAHMNIPVDSPSRAIQAVRGRLQRATSESAGAVVFVKALLDIDVGFASSNEARIASFALVEDVIKHDCMIDDAYATFARALEKADKFINTESNSWMFAEVGVAVPTSKPLGNQVAVVDGVQTKVGVNTDGSIKKGGKKVLSLEIYRRELAKGDVKMSDYTKMLMKELGMSTVGARTYAYATKKEHEAEQSGN